MSTGLENLQKEFERRLKESGPAKIVVVVGYTQDYALQVHEVPAKHKPGKQHKYLEGPARENEDRIVDLCTRPLQASFAERMLRAGLFLQRKSQEVVPIDTGALKASAFTSLEAEATQAAEVAYLKSEALKQSVINRRAGVK